MNDTPVVKPKALFMVLAICCFGILGALTGKRSGTDILLVAAFSGGGLAFGWLGLGILGRLLYVVSPSVRKRHGYAGIRHAIGSGFLMLVPFTILAAGADLYLGWNAVQAFAAAGIMTGGASAGMELAKLGGGRLTSTLLTGVGAFVLSGGWMLLTTVGQSMWKGLT